jgi:UV DNA damage endonuclease
MIRWGLCCSFRDEPIKFGNTTVASVRRMSSDLAIAKLSRLCLQNAAALLTALQYCASHAIGCFRVNSQILPLKTHPDFGYQIDALPDGPEIAQRFQDCRAFARAAALRTCFHPDQFVVLNSPRPDVVQSSLRELEYQAEVAEWIGADVINIHAGGAYGDKTSALAAFERNLDRLSDRARKRLTIENDDTIYSPADLLPLSQRTGLPLVYDVHHHRCLPDKLTIDEATCAALATWNREPLMHISSPRDGWGGLRPERHHDFIDLADFPHAWHSVNATIEIEAKAKELAVLRLRDQFQSATQIVRA